MDEINWNEFLCPYEQAVKELHIKFEGIMNEYKRYGMYSPIESVLSRVKKITSIEEKATRKNVPAEKLEEIIEDIAGIRILCRFVEDIEKVILLIRRRNGSDMTIIEEKDYITNTKPSGYRSYHIIIKYPLHTALGYREVLAEIQIRTLAMNFWATAEHSLKYKYSGIIPDRLKKRLVICAEAAFNLDNEMSKIRGEIMFAQRLDEIKDTLGNEIMQKMQRLYYNMSQKDMDKIHDEFLKHWQDGDVEALKKFDNQLDMMIEFNNELL